MKHIILALLAITATSAFANNTICSGPKLYYSWLQADSGIRQEPATWTVFATLEDGTTLTYSASPDLPVVPEYTVEFSDDQPIFSRNGNAEEYSIYEVTASVKKGGAVVISDRITCVHTQQFLP